MLCSFSQHIYIYPDHNNSTTASPGYNISQHIYIYILTITTALLIHQVTIFPFIDNYNSVTIFPLSTEPYSPFSVKVHIFPPSNDPFSPAYFDKFVLILTLLLLLSKSNIYPRRGDSYSPNVVKYGIF